jgi:glycosyltransferase involved in cell wall biosynthesis
MTTTDRQSESSERAGGPAFRPNMDRKGLARVAFLVDSPSQRAHGNAASRLALGLAESGRAETILVCYSDDPRPAWLPPEVGVHRLGVDRVSRSLPALVRYLRSQQPDVLITRQVHANFVGMAAAWMARVGPPRWSGKLVLVQDHPIELSHASNRRDNKWVAKVAYRFADGFMCPSPAVREDVIRWCGLEPGSVVVVPNPIPKFVGPLGSPPHPWLQDGGPPVFVNASNMMPWKRLDLLIDAFARLRRTCDARLLILGTGPEKARAEQQIRQLGLTGTVETLGWVEDPLQFAARAWAFVLASDEEGFAQVLTEAMSVACPVITTDARGGGPRFVTDGGTYGLLVPRGDAAQLSEAMAHVLRPEVRARYSEVGEQRANAFSPLISATVLLDFLSQRFA